MQYSVEPVKQKLLDYIELEKDILNQIERLERLNAKMYGLSSPALTGMPGGSSGVTDKITYLMAKRDEIQLAIDDKKSRRDKNKGYLEKLILGLSKADERAVIELRYFDNEKWDDVNEVIFGKKEDFNKKVDSYLRRTHMIHGDALMKMARMEYETSGGES